MEGIATGICPLADRLAEALGLLPTWSKFVIEVEIDDIVKVYVKGYVDTDKMKRIAEAFEVLPVQDVNVADDCTVVVTPIPTLPTERELLVAAIKKGWFGIRISTGIGGMWSARPVEANGEPGAFREYHKTYDGAIRGLAQFLEIIPATA